MLIISNGAPKSGSTWLWNIVAQMVITEELPMKYTNKALSQKKEREKSIDEHDLKEFLQCVDYKNNNYLSKNHYFNEATLKLIKSEENVKILGVRRDLRDVVTSYYYHQLRLERFNWDFEKYYWAVGRYFLFLNLQYRKRCYINHNNIYIVSYEGLKQNFKKECMDLGSFLGVSLNNEDIKKLEEKTSLQNLRKKRGEEKEDKKFFRKGVVGDWKNHFNQEILDDYNNIIRNGLSRFDFLRYKLMYPIRQDVKRTLKYYFN